MHDANNDEGRRTNDVRLFVHSSRFVERVSLLVPIRGSMQNCAPHIGQTRVLVMATINLTIYGKGELKW